MVTWEACTLPCSSDSLDIKQETKSTFQNKHSCRVAPPARFAPCLGTHRPAPSSLASCCLSWTSAAASEWVSRKEGSHSLPLEKLEL